MSYAESLVSKRPDDFRLACELFLWLRHKTGSKPDSLPTKKTGTRPVFFVGRASEMKIELCFSVSFIYKM